MERLLEVIRKILVLLNIVVMGGCGVGFLYMTIASKEFEVILYSIAFFTVGVVLHFLINWIFKPKDKIEKL